jgi:hypothetical protein
LWCKIRQGRKANLPNEHLGGESTGHILLAIKLQGGEILLAVGGVNASPNSVRLVVNTSGVSVYGTFNNNNSDRNAKERITYISPSEILNKVSQLPVAEWSYKVDASTRHLGR